MTLLRTIIALVLAASTVLASNSANEAKQNLKKENFPIQIDASSKMIYAQKGEVLQSAPNFYVLDTLYNAYSYFSNEQQPFVYDSYSANLITIYRGSSASGIDSKDNLFIRTSANWGATWEEPILVYNNTSYAQHMARYPSVYPILYDGTNSFVFSAPTTRGDGWSGLFTGFYYADQDVSVIDHKAKFNINSQDYGFLNDGKIIACPTSTGYYGLAISGALPFGGNPWELNSNIAARSTTDFESWNVSVPAGWSTSLFVDATQDSTRSASLVDLIQTKDGKIYMAAYGNFKADAETTKKPVPAVSIAQAPGEEFSSLEDLRMPYNLLTNYAQGKGALLDSTFMTWGEKGFNVFENGEFSFVFAVYESNALKPEGTTLRTLVEANHKNNQWTMREVAVISGYTTNYIESETNTVSNNQMGLEIQLSKTDDGNYFVCKWVDFPTVYGERDSTTDIFISVRHKDSTIWSDPINLTNTNSLTGIIYLDHITWIPTTVPSDFSSLPVIQMATIPFDGATESYIARAIDKPQFILVSPMNHLDIPAMIKYNGTSSVEDTDAALEMSISPNPANYDAFINLNINTLGNLNIELFDVMGQKLNTIYNGQTEAGHKSYRINTSALSSGVYYAVITLNGNKFSQIINVLH